MEEFGIDESNIVALLQSVLLKEGISEGEIVIKGTSGVGDGFTGIVIFADATGTKNGNEVVLNFVVKHSSKNNKQRERMPITILYKLESHVYNTILPAYQEHLKEHNLPPLDCLPKWYADDTADNREIIVLENLKSKGYEINNAKKTFTLEHLKLILLEYAKWHSLGFSLRDQNPNKFENITSNVVEIRANVTKGFINFFERMRKVCVDSLKLYGEMELIQKIEKHSVGEILEIAARNDKYSTILHGDCWNNNYLFKCKADNGLPEKVAIIDWQLVSIGSPVADISYSIFASIGQENFDEIEELLEYYYSQFSSFLLKLGSDPNKLYPKSEFLKNWKDYAKYSLIFIPTVFMVVEREASDIPDINKLESVADMFTATGDKNVNTKTIAYVRYLSDKGLI